MFSIFKKKKEPEIKEVFLSAPVTGQTVNLSEVPDEVFGSKMMGEGIAFSFSGERIVSPCDATVMLIAETLHAIGLKADNGAEILLHIGLDTTELKGKGFKPLVAVNQKVETGEPLIIFDRKFVEAEGFDLITPMVITNSGDFNITPIDGNLTVVEKETTVLHFS